MIVRLKMLTFSLVFYIQTPLFFTKSITKMPWKKIKKRIKKNKT
jgi:hypothetical protein